MLLRQSTRLPPIKPPQVPGTLMGNAVIRGADSKTILFVGLKTADYSYFLMVRSGFKGV